MELSCQSIITANLHNRHISIAELIFQKRNYRTRQPRTTVFKLSDSRKEFCKRCGGRKASDNTPHVLLTADTYVKEVLLVFDEDIG